MATKKKPGTITTRITPRGVALEHEDGTRDYLRVDALPAARKAITEGTTHPWVAVAIQAWDAQD